MKKWIAWLLLLTLLLTGCAENAPQENGERIFCAGFASVTLPLPENSAPLYIAGYHSGWEIQGVLDLQQIRGLWLEDGKTSTLLIVVDCIALGADTVAQIRQQLREFCRETGCDQVNVIATHTHAGVDTLGLWGPMAIDGKNDAFMETVISGAVDAAKAAYADRKPGKWFYSSVKTEGLQEDSRDPQIWDEHIYQFRFAPVDEGDKGIRLLSFAAHAEALRGDNTYLSRDYPGVVCDRITRETGDDTIFLPGAIGGLIMTPEFSADPVENMELTGEKIAEAALTSREERELQPNLQLARVEFEVELDNTLFLYYKFLGILGNSVRRDWSGTYWLSTELTLLQLGDVTVALLPGEIFPELVTGTENAEDPRSLQELAKSYGCENLIVISLANDEIGYIVPPGDFVLDGELPYVQEAEGDHYEETNAVGKNCARFLTEAFQKALQELTAASGA